MILTKTNDWIESQDYSIFLWRLSQGSGLRNKCSIRGQSTVYFIYIYIYIVKYHSLHYCFINVMNKFFQTSMGWKHSFALLTHIPFPCVCIYVYLYIYRCVCIYIYIYIYIERERERGPQSLNERDKRWKKVYPLILWKRG